MQGARKDRVGQLLQQELSRLIVTELKDPRIGIVTITHVGMSADLRSARVFYSVIGNADVRKKTDAALKKAAGFLQKEIGHNIELRNTPKLTFQYDDSLDRGLEVDKVLRTIHESEKKINS